VEEYKVEKIVSFAGGLIGLSANQAKRRKHNLKPVKLDDAGAGVYEIINPVQFKVGETIKRDSMTRGESMFVSPVKKPPAKLRIRSLDRSRKKAAKKAPAKKQ